MELNYSDVILVPKYSQARTRSAYNTKVELKNQHKSFEFSLPIVPANMVCCINTNIAVDLDANNCFYVLHRFYPSYIEYFNAIKSIASTVNVLSISVGVKEEDRALLKSLKEAKIVVDIITIDIAHGHSVMMKEMIEWIRKSYSKNVIIIAGNIGTPQAVLDLARWGADVAKVGIGPGSSCITKDKTGFLTPMFSTVRDIAAVAKIPIIADGGIKTNGDVAKALVAGADLVMAGSWFSCLKDSPAETIEKIEIENGLQSQMDPISGLQYQALTQRERRNKFKRYFGSASADNKLVKKHIEGTAILLPMLDITYNEALELLKQDLQSAMSYAGVYDSIKELRMCEYKILK